VKIWGGKCKKLIGIAVFCNYSVNSPRKDCVRYFSICLRVSFFPSKYISLATAASVVMSLPLTTPILAKPSLVS